MSKNITALLSVIPLLFFQACIPDAPHDNPIDPYLASSNNGLTFTGHVYTVYPPYQPLENVKVTLENGGKFAVTDNSGVFTIDDLDEKSYSFILQKENYQPDTLNVAVSSQNRTKDFYLNALPQLSAIQYYSHKVSTIFSADPVISAVIEMEVTDPDGPGDIDSARVIIDAFSFQANLQVTLPVGSFQMTISQQDISAYNIYALVEKALRIEISDKAGSKNNVGPFYMSRFIEIIPEAISPANQENVTQPVIFQWQDEKLPYPFTYEISIFKRESGLSQLVFSQSGINPQINYYNYNNLLGPGIYYWTIKIVDALNNSSESKEAVFQIR
jgi:hypothetical protein